ncbi:MAG: AAA family ATPase, partial [Microcoleus sp. T3-bin5]|nr:AAA family ATPase [Microcoleus sp. T3-bin5]
MAIISSKQQPPDPNLPQDIAPARRKKVAKPQAESLLESQELPEEINSKQDDKIRPQRLAEYIGQKDLREVLAIAIAAAKSRREPMDHLLLYGPPGLGKTTMSLILAAEMEVECKITTAPALEKPRDIVGLLINLKA